MEPSGSMTNNFKKSNFDICAIRLDTSDKSQFYSILASKTTSFLENLTPPTKKSSKL